MRLRLLGSALSLSVVLAACSAPVTSTPAPAESPTNGCSDVSAPAAKDSQISEPSGSLDSAKSYTVTLTTNCGDISILLDAKSNPKTANAFAHLVREGYFNKTSFHRVVPGFVIQGGDPAGNGSGGPPWKVVEAPPANTKYSQGVVAMAKTEAEAAGTSGSQFFIVTAPDAGLQPDYAVAGKVSAGMDVVNRIAALGEQGSDGPPSKPVVIESATIAEK